MRARVVTLALAAAVVAAGLFIGSPDLAGQAAPANKPAAAGGIPRMPDGKPDLQGT